MRNSNFSKEHHTFKNKIEGKKKEMPGNVDNICRQMDQDTKNIQLQLNCIVSLYGALKDERQNEEFQKAFKAVDKVQRDNISNDQITLQVLNLCELLSQVPTAALPLETTNIFSILKFILAKKKEDPHISEICLLTISQTISLPKMAGHFTSDDFINSLVFVARLNSRSQIHALYISNIALFLPSTLGIRLKDLCLAFVAFSRNFPKNKQLQKSIMVGLAHIVGEKVLKEIASVVIPHFSDISTKYIHNLTILKSMITILSYSPAPAIETSNLLLILKQTKKLKDDRQSIMNCISILHNKFNPKRIPLDVLSLISIGLSMFLSNAAVLKQALTVCYYALTSTNEMVPVFPSLIQKLTSVLLVHSKDPSIVRRSAAILHSFSFNQENDTNLSQSSAASALLQAAQFNIGDKHSIECIIAALSNFGSQNKQIAIQIATPDNLKLLTKICSMFKKEIKVVKSAILLIKSLALSIYSFREFIDMPESEKKDYLISKKIGVLILQKQLSNLNLIKATLLLMPSSPDQTDFIAPAMVKYSKDEEIQLAGLLHNITDLSAINRALLLCGEDGLRYAMKSLQKTEEILPPQTIEFLLSIDRCDAIDILLLHVKRASASAIAVQFRLLYVEQVVIAYELYEKDLWKPTDQDSSLIITALYHSTYDPRQLYAALSFSKEIGLTDSSFPFLIDAMAKFPSNREIVALSAEFIAALTPTKQIESICAFSEGDSNPISTAAFALEFNKDDEPVVYSLLKMFYFFSTFDILIPKFSQSLIIPIIVDAADQSDRCCIQCCYIMNNLVQNKDCAVIMENSNISDIAFDYFRYDFYGLIDTLMENADLNLSYKQFKVTIEHLEKVSTKIPPNRIVSLLRIVLKYFETDEDQIKDLDYKFLTPLLTVHSSNPLIVQLVASLITYSDGYKSSEELLFAILEALKYNIQEHDTVLAIMEVISDFSSMSKHASTFKAQPTVDILSTLIKLYSSDVMICTTCFNILQEIPIPFDICSKVMFEQTDAEALKSVAQYVMSVSDEYDISPMMDAIFVVMKRGINDTELYANLLPSVFFTSQNMSAHPLVLQNFELIIKLFVRYSSNFQVSLAFLGIMCNISSNQDNIPRIEQYVPLIGVAMKTYIDDDQIQHAGSQAIINFAAAGKEELFFTIFPILDLALKQAAALESVCEAISKLSDYLGEFAPIFALDIFKLMVKHAEDETVGEEDEEGGKFSTLASCLQPILQHRRAEDIIFDKISKIMKLIKRSNDESVVSSLIDICASLRNSEKIFLLQPLIPILIDLAKKPKYKVALSSANCLLNIASISPEMIDPYIDEIIQLTNKSTGELLRIFLQVKSAFYGIKRHFD